MEIGHQVQDVMVFLVVMPHSGEFDFAFNASGQSFNSLHGSAKIATEFGP